MQQENFAFNSSLRSARLQSHLASEEKYTDDNIMLRATYLTYLYKSVFDPLF